METQYLISENAQKGALVVGVQKEDSPYLLEDLEEMVSLLETLDIPTKEKLIQKRHRLSPAYLIGEGKADEIAGKVRDQNLGLVIIDHPLTGLQVKNLESRIGCQVLDRSGVILDIFARHARTNEAKTQVEIAKLEYLLPRLTGAWTHFQRQTGGGVTGRGMGEKQIEIDRRRARERITRLKKRLHDIKKERLTQSKLRKDALKVALVGYTNSGKTSLMKGLTRSDIQGKDVLFATLDAQIRSIDPDLRPPILISDTVGFIRHLPHSLVDSFRATLEEVLAADLLIHVVDVSASNYHLQMEATETVLAEIHGDHIPTILVFNKMDRLPQETFLPKILKKKYEGSISLSALRSEDMRDLRSHIFGYFHNRFQNLSVRISLEDQKTLSFIHRFCFIESSDYDQDPGWGIFSLRAPESTLSRLKKDCLP
jgi:GTP-binding protein HflX